MAEVSPSPYISLRGPAQDLHPEREARVWWDGWVDGWVGRNIKSVLQFSIYFVGIHIIYMYTYIYSQKLSAQISCGFLIPVKLVLRVQRFKNTLKVGFFQIILKAQHQISPIMRGQKFKNTVKVRFF